MQNTAFQKATLLNIVNHYITLSYNKTVCYISTLDDEPYIQKLITTAHPKHCLEILRMDLYVFLALTSWLEENIALKESQNHFTIYQKLAIFLQILRKADSNCDVQETFQHFKTKILAVF